MDQKPKNKATAASAAPSNETELLREDAPSAEELATPSATEATPAKDKPKKTATKKASTSKSTSQTVRSSTADKPVKTPAKAASKSKTKGEIAPKVGLRSERPAHRVMPYLLLIVSAFLLVCFALNLFCNYDNVLAENPSAHWMGQVGYHICYAIFGMLGGAAFALPILMLNLAFYWKKYVDNGILLVKFLAALVIQVLLSAVVHVFCLSGIADPSLHALPAAELISQGAQMRGGGLLGGGLGYFLTQYLNIIGSLVVGILLLAVLLFCFLGMTPHHLMARFSLWREQKKEQKRSRESQVVEKETPNSSKKETTKKEKASEPASQRDPEEELAPMPTPRVNPDDEDHLFLPPELSRQMSEASTSAPVEEEKTAPTPASAVSENKTSPTPAANEEPTQSAGAQFAKNRDAAVEPIFPRTSEIKPTRKIPREDRNFDLKKVFIDFDEKEPMPTRRHAPLPPEKPMTGLRTPAQPTATQRTATAASSTQARPTTAAASASAVRRPVAGAAPTVQKTVAGAPLRQTGTAAAQTAAQSTAQAATRPSTASKPLPARMPSPAAQPTATAQRTAAATVGATPAKAAAGTSQKPIFRQASATGKKDFGLSSEEFEKLEAARKTPDLSGKKATAATAATASKATAAKAGSAKAPAAKDAVPTSSDQKPAKSKRYTFPPISYLHPAEPMTEENKAEIEESMQRLAEALESFRVRVQEINYSCGPTVTRYEVILAPGVRVRSVTNLSNDIALALRSSGGVRIEAPIPGTNAVGIEVPNKTRSTIYLRDMIESKTFTESKSKLSACLGADIAGQPLIFDIAKMPHLLVAGTTGSGKSVCINCIIMSILYKARPDEVKLILIDPKKVEFSIYKNIPHLMAPVVTAPKDAAGALQAAVEEMERRFEIFEAVGVRDLKGYNALTKDDPDVPHLPQLVIIIDELADLMMTAKNEVETAICRIAQKARAAGMHLIIGTQRPSVDVVTGLIKANVPSSIAFAVKSQMDSRVILDHGGAEALTGRGDMLFVPIGSMRDTRVQGAFVDDKEVERICEFIRVTNGSAVYDERFTNKMKEFSAQCNKKGSASTDDFVSEGGDGETRDDPKYVDALRVAIEEKRASTSLLQRKLGVGYSRAAKLVDRMEADGYVSKAEGSKPREILITAEEFLEKFVDGAPTPEDGE